MPLDELMMMWVNFHFNAAKTNASQLLQNNRISSHKDAGAYIGRLRTVKQRSPMKEFGDLSDGVILTALLALLCAFDAEAEEGSLLIVFKEIKVTHR